MIPMQTPRGALWILVGTVLLICIGGLLYADLLIIPARIAVPLSAAFALEAGFYAAAVLSPIRLRLAGALAPRALAGITVLSAVLPYCAYAIPTGVFRWDSFGIAVALAAALSFWYVVLPRRPAVDAVFLAVVAAIVLLNPFARIYASPVPRLQFAILGQSMWTRLAIFESLAVARMEVEGFGFWPDRREWATGVANFLIFIPAGVLVGWATGFAQLRLRPWPWWQIAILALGTFFGMLWVVALREEFFFRGLLQKWLAAWLGNRWAGLVLASVLFGAAHLPFRAFPNWRFALLATVAGLCYGRAWMNAKSVRSAMVTHALVNTAWRVFFS